MMLVLVLRTSSWLCISRWCFRWCLTAPPSGALERGVCKHACVANWLRAGVVANPCNLVCTVRAGPRICTLPSKGLARGDRGHQGAGFLVAQDLLAGLGRGHAYEPQGMGGHL